MHALKTALCAAALVLAATPAFAWGDKGHRLITTLGVQALPAELPAFLKVPANVHMLGEFAREPDRSRGAGQPHDADLDPGHFVDVDDEGRVLGGPLLDKLPRDRVDYEKALLAAGTDSGDGGYLPYNLTDGWQHLVKDFAYWRAARVGERRAATPQLRQRYRVDREQREILILRDLGYWSHFVGDASNPMHASVHYNGWGKYPNPNNYTQDKIHGAFEDAFVVANTRREAVKAAMSPPATGSFEVREATRRYLRASHELAVPLYKLWTEGGFANGDPRGVAFANARLAAGASELRDWVTQAWRASADMGVGYPAMPVKAIEAGQTIPPETYFGRD